MYVFVHLHLNLLQLLFFLLYWFNRPQIKSRNIIVPQTNYRSPPFLLLLSNCRQFNFRIDCILLILMNRACVLSNVPKTRRFRWSLRSSFLIYVNLRLYTGKIAVLKMGCWGVLWIFVKSWLSSHFSNCGCNCWHC